MRSGVICAVREKELTDDEMSEWLKNSAGPITGPNSRAKWVDAPTHMNCRERFARRSASKPCVVPTAMEDRVVVGLGLESMARSRPQ